MILADRSERERERLKNRGKRKIVFPTKRVWKEQVLGQPDSKGKKFKCFASSFSMGHLEARVSREMRNSDFSHFLSLFLSPPPSRPPSFHKLNCEQKFRWERGRERERKRMKTLAIRKLIKFHERVGEKEDKKEREERERSPVFVAGGGERN